jgi:hypothetical protein
MHVTLTSLSFICYEYRIIFIGNLGDVLTLCAACELGGKQWAQRNTWQGMQCILCYFNCLTPSRKEEEWSSVVHGACNARIVGSVPRTTHM